MFRLSILVALLSLPLLASCATTGERSSTDTDVLTREQIVSGSYRNLYELIQRERPRWLTTRGQRSFGLTTGIVVYQDQTRLGTVEVLRNMSPGMATWIEHLDPSESSRLPGLRSEHVDGVIVVHTRPRR